MAYVAESYYGDELSFFEEEVSENEYHGICQIQTDLRNQMKLLCIHAASNTEQQKKNNLLHFNHILNYTNFTFARHTTSLPFFLIST